MQAKLGEKRTYAHAAFDPIKRILPGWASGPIRRVGTAVLTPIRESARSGHFLSSLRAAAVDSANRPTAWYTYPCLNFLTLRDFSNCSVLEFGGGHSSIWWGARAANVVTFEGDLAWLARIRPQVPSNVQLHHAPTTDPQSCLDSIDETLPESAKFDVVVIDGLFRRELAERARGWLTSRGIIVCDNSEGYGFQEALADSGMNRLDFYGSAPGVILPHCTSIYFGPECPLLSASLPIATEPPY